jgi:hypothetical protein
LYRRPRTQIIKEVRIMKKNIGDIERLIRLVAGLAIVLLFFVGPKTPWALLGIVPVVTGLAGWCPPYTLLGINTRKKSEYSTEERGSRYYT